MDTMMAPYGIVRTSMPEALVNVYTVSGFPVPPSVLPAPPHAHVAARRVNARARRSMEPYSTRRRQARGETIAGPRGRRARRPPAPIARDGDGCVAPRGGLRA